MHHIRDFLYIFHLYGQFLLIFQFLCEMISNKSRIDAMNEKLDNLDFMMEKISELGMTELVFDNDGDSPFSYTVYGAFIDGKAKVSWTEKVTPGDESTVAFGRKSEDSIWHEIVPIVFLSGK